MENIEVLAENNTHSALNSLIQKTLAEDKKMEEDLHFFLDNNASLKKEVRDEKNKTLQHNQNKDKKFFDEHFP